MTITKDHLADSPCTCLEIPKPEIFEKETTKEDPDVYNYIFRYYSSKNIDFKGYIQELCKEKTKIGGVVIGVDGFTFISALSSNTEIESDILIKLSNRDYLENEVSGYEIDTIIKLYEDIQKLYKLFMQKNKNVDYKTILTTFKKIIDDEEQENHLNELFNIIKQKENEQLTAREITERYLKYILRTSQNISLSNTVLLEEISKKELLPLLNKFGFIYGGFTNELFNLFYEIVSKLIHETTLKKIESERSELDAFESELDSSYENLDSVNKDIDDSDKGYDNVSKIPQCLRPGRALFKSFERIKRLDEEFEQIKDEIHLMQVEYNQFPEVKIDRYIPPEVKLNVWRRDQGKCVECGSKEKLEYDHMIPISKGGSNRERNVQLLCQNCNRKKAAGIQ
jgi:hypothetical protein